MKLQLQINQIDTQILKPTHIQQIFQHIIALQNENHKAFKNWELSFRYDAIKNRNELFWDEMINRLTAPEEGWLTVLAMQVHGGLILGIISSLDEEYLFSNSNQDLSCIQVLDDEHQHWNWGISDQLQFDYYRHAGRREHKGYYQIRPMKEENENSKRIQITSSNYLDDFNFLDVTKYDMSVSYIKH